MSRFAVVETVTPPVPTWLLPHARLDNRFPVASEPALSAGYDRLREVDLEALSETRSGWLPSQAKHFGRAGKVLPVDGTASHPSKGGIAVRVQRYRDAEPLARAVSAAVPGFGSETDLGWVAPGTGVERKHVRCAGLLVPINRAVRFAENRDAAVRAYRQRRDKAIGRGRGAQPGAANEWPDGFASGATYRDGCGNFCARTLRPDQRGLEGEQCDATDCPGKNSWSGSGIYLAPPVSELFDY